MPDPLIFALAAGRDYAEAVCARLGVALSAHEEREFEDGEHKIRPRVNVRGRQVFVLQSLYGDASQSVNEKLCRLLFFIGALKDAAADKVTAVIPYLCYARKDRKTKSRDPVTTRYLACLLEAVGADHVVTLDVHNPAAFQNAFRCPTDHLEAVWLFAEYLKKTQSDRDLVVMSPDVGGVKRAERLREALEATLKRPLALAFMEKKRSAGVVSGETLVGDVAGKGVILFDDMISSGGTLRRAAGACAARQAGPVFAMATHGLFMAGAEDLLAAPAVERVVVTDTVPPFRLPAEKRAGKLVVLETAPLIAEAIRRMHDGGSIVELLERPQGSPS